MSARGLALRVSSNSIFVTHSQSAGLRKTSREASVGLQFLPRPRRNFLSPTPSPTARAGPGFAAPPSFARRVDRSAEMLKGKKVWCKDASLSDTDVYVGGTCTADDGKQARR